MGPLRSGLPRALTSKTQRSQQHKVNMENHRSLKRTLLQAEIQKTSEKQLFTYSDSKQNGKEHPEVLPSVNIGKRISNIHESTRRFNTRPPKNLKEHLTAQSKRQNTDADRKKQPNLTISGAEKACPGYSRQKHRLCRQHMPGKTHAPRRSRQELKKPRPDTRARKQAASQTGPRANRTR
jgi:hypothetical protein